MVRNSPFAPVLSFLLLSSVPLAAQATSDDEKELAALLNNAIVSASRWEQSASKAPAKIVVITADEIKRRGYLGLDEIFHDIPGADIDKGRGVEWTTVFMRGMRTENTDRFLLIWDGVIQNDTWKYNVWVSRQYPLSNIDRIEIMYGPSSLLWGANAFAGIINVILKTPGQVDGMTVNATAGSYNSRMGELNYGRQYGDWRFMANGRWFASDEMDMNDEYWIDNAGRKRYQNWILSRDGLRDPSDPSGYAKGLKVVNGIPHQSFNGVDVPFDGTAYGDTKDWFIQAGAGYKSLDFRALFWSRNEIEDNWYVPLRRMHGPWTPVGSAIYLTHDLKISDTTFLKSYARRVTAGLDSDHSIDAAFTRIINNNRNDPNNLKTSDLGTGSGVMTYYGLSNYEIRTGELLNTARGRWEAVGGWEYTKAKNYEDYNTRTLTSAPWKYSPQHDERNAAAFGNAQWSPSAKLSVAGGIRFDHNYVHGEKGGFGDLTTHRIAGIYSPSDQHVVKLIYGQAFQAPSPWAKFSTTPGRDIANPTLKPEKLQSTELVYTFTPSLSWVNTLSIYNNKVTDIIAGVTVPFGTGVTTQNQNSGSLKIFGQELESRYYLDSKNSIWFNATASRTTNEATGHRQGDLAPFKANLGTDLLFQKKWAVSARAHYVSARDTINQHSTDIFTKGHVDAYFTIDAAVTRVGLAKNVDVRVGVYNLLNEHYEDPGVRAADGRGNNAVIVQEGRRGYVGVAYHF